MNVLIRVIFIYLLFACQNLTAVEVQGLYEVEVSAKSEQEADRVEAIQRALKQVLTRILSGKNILQDDTVNTVLSNAIHYVNEYQYSLAVIKGKESMRLMRVLFNDELLIDMLHPGQLGYWNEIRPRTLVWLVVENEGGTDFFDAGTMPEIDAAMVKAAKLKALPVLYPIQDLSEARVLSISDVLSAYSEHLLEVSTRYDVVSTLAGKITKQEGCWRAEWTLYFDEKIDQWRSQCSSINEMALSGFQGVYDRLSSFYAVQPDVAQVNSFIMEVAGVSGIPKLTKVTDYLESLSMVKTVTWVGFEDGYNFYRVFYQGNRQILNDLLVKGRVLRIENFSEQNSSQVKYKLLVE